MGSHYKRGREKKVTRRKKKTKTDENVNTE